MSYTRKWTDEEREIAMNVYETLRDCDLHDAVIVVEIQKELEKHGYTRTLDAVKMWKYKHVILKAMKQRGEKDMSCDLCCENDFDKFERGHSPDNHGFIISQNGLYYCDSGLGWEGIQINYCPKCGRKLNDDLL